MPIMKYVTRDQQKILETGNEIIEQVKARLSYGSGNQKNSKPGAYERTLKAYKMSHKKEADPRFLYPRRTAIAAVAAQAGNCDHMGSYAYMLARNEFGPEYQVALCQMAKAGHTFCAVGKPGWPRGQYVAIDPWPIQTQAMLLEDHFSKGVFEGFYPKPGKSINFSKYDEILEDKQREITDYWNSLTPEQRIMKAPKDELYNHQYAFRSFRVGREYVPRTVEYLPGEHNVIQPIVGDNEADAGGGESADLVRAIEPERSPAHNESSPAYAPDNEAANAEGYEAANAEGYEADAGGGESADLVRAIDPEGRPAHNDPAYAGGYGADAEGRDWDDYFWGLSGAGGNSLAANTPPQDGTSLREGSRSRSPLLRDRSPSPGPSTGRRADTPPDNATELENARAVAALLASPEWLVDE
jgi:hypothetical protein